MADVPKQSPYLTYLSNTNTQVWAATSNAVVFEKSLVLDARFDWSQKDLVFEYEILGDESSWLDRVQGPVHYAPEPGTLVMLSGGVLALVARRRPSACRMDQLDHRS